MPNCGPWRQARRTAIESELEAAIEAVRVRYYQAKLRSAIYLAVTHGTALLALASTLLEIMKSKELADAVYPIAQTLLIGFGLATFGYQLTLAATDSSHARGHGRVFEIAELVARWGGTVFLAFSLAAALAAGLQFLQLLGSAPIPPIR
jgi:hypothetical protein